MSDKRYSIFISSTFEDLKVERQAVQDVVLSAGDFPVQMESFPAADENQFEFIKALIDKCDYYVLIIAGRYGTASADGMSYTEKEYRYAVSRGVPVLVMLHGEPGNIPASKSEETAEGRVRLKKFIGEVQTGRLRKTWTTSEALKLAVREALEHAKATKPAIGWVRGDVITSKEALEELNQVRKENAKYRDLIGGLEVELALPPIPSADSTLEIDIFPKARASNNDAPMICAATVEATWIAIFPLFLNNLKWYPNDWNGDTSYYVDEEASCLAIGSAIACEAASIHADVRYRISNTALSRLISYYIEVGLMNSEGAEKAFNEAASRVARRHNIAADRSGNFRVIRGGFAKGPVPVSNDFDERIPF